MSRPWMGWAAIAVLSFGCATSSSAPPAGERAEPPAAGTSGAQGAANLATTRLEPVRAVPPPDCPAPKGTSRLWTDFVAARNARREPVLPDFSYAGYRDSNEPLPEANESFGQPVSPPSLFEAQLAWRTCRPSPAAPVVATPRPR